MVELNNHVQSEDIKLDINYENYLKASLIASYNRNLSKYDHNESLLHLSSFKKSG